MKALLLALFAPVALAVLDPNNPAVIFGDVGGYSRSGTINNPSSASNGVGVSASKGPETINVDGEEYRKLPYFKSEVELQKADGTYTKVRPIYKCRSGLVDPINNGDNGNTGGGNSNEEPSTPAPTPTPAPIPEIPVPAEVRNAITSLGGQLNLYQFQETCKQINPSFEFKDLLTSLRYANVRSITNYTQIAQILQGAGVMVDANNAALLMDVMLGPDLADNVVFAIFYALVNAAKQLSASAFI